MKNVDSVIVQYVGGPRDGVVEELTRHTASRVLLVGGADDVAPDGWYSGTDSDGPRFWREGAPEWWTPRQPRVIE